MGVQGLWELLTPVGRRVSVDTLGSRKLAIDASIWIIQFMKAMRDDKGDMIRNAHLLGFFRRICKLLFLRIKPVFVFDGGTPALKRRTVLARRRQRENAQSKIRKTAEKLLLNHLRSRKLEEIVSEIGLVGRVPQKQAAASESGKILQPTPMSDQAFGTMSDDYNQTCSLFTSKAEQEAADALLAASLETESEENAQIHGGSAGASQEASDEDDDHEEIMLPATQGQLDPTVLASLPPSMQLDLLVQMREKLVAENRQRFQRVAKEPSSFSQLQIQAYLKTVAFRREINEVQKAAAGRGIGGVPTVRIASATDREFIFSSSYQGDKPTISAVQGQGSSEQTTSSPVQVCVSQTPAVSGAPSSVVISALQRVQQIAEGNILEVHESTLDCSTEDVQSNSNSSVQTYVDDKGHVRVSRVRGMGVRMTRDLQWNLYLMKDIEARQSQMSVSDNRMTSPCTDPGRSEVSTIGPPVAGNSSQRRGLQISFVNDGAEKVEEDEDEDLFADLVKEGGALDQKTILAGEKPISVIKAPASSKTTGILRYDDEEDVCEWEGDMNNEYSGGLEEDREFAEAVRVSLGESSEVNSTDHVLVEEGPISEESEVEWEDGSGAVILNGVDASSGKETDISRFLTSEEAEIEEAIRRSLEDFAPAAKGLAGLKIQEPLNNTPSRSLVAVTDDSANIAPPVPPEQDSEELYLARERTRKGKAVLEGNATVLKSTGLERQVMGIPDQGNARGTQVEQITTCVSAKVTEQSLQTSQDENLKDEARSECQMLETTSSVNGSFDILKRTTDLDAGKFLPKQSESIQASSLGGFVENQELGVHSMVEFSEAVPVKESKSEESIQLVEYDQGSNEPSLSQFHPSREPVFSSRTSLGLGDTGCDTTTDDLIESVQRGPILCDGDLIREAEEFDISREREQFVQESARLRVEEEDLETERAELQAELNAEQVDFQAGLEKEREFLAQEELELLASQRKNERNADSVTGEMFADVQDLLQMFGLPYIIAPMEAEAQCAYLNTIELVDGVITDDCDVFLFGAQYVYRNIFDDRKYVEIYYMKDVETEMGLTRDKLIHMALLLGSDYTEGISGIGIVNAIEVVNAFSEENGLKKFKIWLDSPDLSLIKQVQSRSLNKDSVKGGRGVGLQDPVTQSEGNVPVDDDLSEGLLGDSGISDLSARQRTFMSKHRVVSKNWNIPESFPSEAVVAAYRTPQVDKSTEKFTWGRPDLDALRKFCYDKFGWSKEKADELLLPVLKEYDRRETQTRLESFYNFNQRFAKIRSRRIQKAVTGITGRRSAELMEISPHLLDSSLAGEPKEDHATREDSSVFEVGDGQQKYNSGEAHVDGKGGSVAQAKRKSHTTQSGQGRTRTTKISQKVDGNGGKGAEDQCGGKGRRNGQRLPESGRGRGRGRRRGADKVQQKEGNSSDPSDSDGEMLVGIDSLKRKFQQPLPQPRRSRRLRSQVSYKLDDSEENSGGTCSDEEEILDPKKADGPPPSFVHGIQKEASTIILAEPFVNPPQPDTVSINRKLLSEKNIECAPETLRHMENIDSSRQGATNSGEAGMEAKVQLRVSEQDETSLEVGHREQPDYLNLGGGFCLEDQDAAANPVDTVSRDSPGGTSHSEGLEQSESLWTEFFDRSVSEYETQNRRNSNLPDEDEDHTIEVGRSDSRMVDEAPVLGLRAMPFMRKKKRQD